jgi:hypothetical protein
MGCHAFPMVLTPNFLHNENKSQTFGMAHRF